MTGERSEPRDVVEKQQEIDQRAKRAADALKKQ